MYRAAGDAKKIVAPMRSCCSLARPKGIQASTAARRSGVAAMAAFISVGKKPGDRALTPMPCGAYWRASCSIAPLLAV
jgi:hypothetical protein